MAVTTDVNPEEEEEAPKGSKKPLIVGFVLAILGGVGGFMGIKMGLIPIGQPTEQTAESDAETPAPVTEPSNRSSRASLTSLTAICVR